MTPLQHFISFVVAVLAAGLIWTTGVRLCEKKFGRQEWLHI